MPRTLDAVGVLEQYRSTNSHPDDNSLEYWDLQVAIRRLTEKRRPEHIDELIRQVFTRTSAEMEHPIVTSPQLPVLRFAATSPLPMIDPATAYLAQFTAALDNSAPRSIGWVIAGGTICEAHLIDVFGPAASMPGWHRLSLQVAITAWPGRHPDGICSQSVQEGSPPPIKTARPPVWSESRDLGTLVYGVVTTAAPPVASADSRQTPPPNPGEWLASVVATPASQLDSALPELPLDTWLRGLLAEAGRTDLSNQLTWEATYCGPDLVELFPSMPDRSPADMCIRTRVGGNAYRLQLEFSVGPFVDESDDGRAAQLPRLHHGFVAAGKHSADITRLADLELLLKTPSDNWPDTDLRVADADVTYSPLSPERGEIVTVEFAVHNDSARAVRAFIEFRLASGDGGPPERGEFLTDVAAYGEYRFTRRLRLPFGAGVGWAMLQTQLAQPRISFKSMRERDEKNNSATRVLGALSAERE